MDKNRAKMTILKRDALGRVSHTAQQREALLDEFERSGMKGLPFARMAEVNYQTFASWIQKRRRARGDYAMPAPKSTPASGSRPRKAALALVEVALPAVAAVPASAGSALELHLPAGGHLRITDAHQAVLAAHLLRHLELSTTSSTTSAFAC
jgi:hypothetical protein